MWHGADESREVAKGLSPDLRDVLEPLLREIESLNERIAEYDRRIEQSAKEVYPEVALLKQVKGVGTLIGLTYILTLDDPHRFRRSRDAGCFLGLRPGRRNSGMAKGLYWERPPCTERKSLNQECGWKDGDRGGLART